jgi:predicted secreted protein
MKKILTVLFVAVILTLVVTLAIPAEKDGGFRMKKDPGLQQVKPKKPVKIKLKRTAKDEYSWELTGDDAAEMVRTDRKLRKMLNIR